MPGTTVNRLCGSGMDAIGIAARAIKSGEAQLMIAGGVESMTRAPFVMGKADAAFSRQAAIYDTTIGWRFPNTADEAPVRHRLDAGDGRKRRRSTTRSRAQTRTSSPWRSQQKTARAQREGLFDEEIVPVLIPQKKGDPIAFAQDEHPRETSIEALAKLKGVVRPDGTVTAGNASGVNDGACAVLLASARSGRNNMA